MALKTASLIMNYPQLAGYLEANITSARIAIETLLEMVDLFPTRYSFSDDVRTVIEELQKKLCNAETVAGACDSRTFARMTVTR